MIFTLSRISDLTAGEVALAMLADWLMVVTGYVATELPWYLAGARAHARGGGAHAALRARDLPTLARPAPKASCAGPQASNCPALHTRAVFPGLVSFVAFAYVLKALYRMIVSAMREANTVHSRAWCVGRRGARALGRRQAAHGHACRAATRTAVACSWRTPPWAPTPVRAASCSLS